MAVEEASMVEALPTAVEDFTAGAPSAVAEGFAAGAASVAERDSAAAAGFVAARSAEERVFAAGQDFAVDPSAAAFAVTASAAAGASADAVGGGEDGTGAGASAGAGRIIGVGPDTGTRIRMAMATDMATTRGGQRLITRPAMIPTMVLTTPLRPATLRLATCIKMIHTATTGG
jgi:hypothetical protein